MLTFSIMCYMDGNTQTTILTAKESDLLPITPLYPPQPSYSEAFDPRAAWIVVPKISKYVSVSNTVYSESVFKDERTGWYIPEVPYTFTGGVDETKTLYMCYGHPNRTTVGWVKICICGDCAWIEGSCIALGVYKLRAGRTTYTEWPIDPRTFLNGGIRQLDIFVDASAAAGGTGLSWESPFRSIQEAVDAVRLDGTVVHVKPGVYGSVKVDNTKFVTNHLAYTFTVQSTDGPEKTIIDGGHDGTSPGFPTVACFWYGDNPVPLFDTIRGFTLRNSLYGAYYGNVEHCIVSNCAYGVMHASADNCLITANWDIGFGGYGLRNCTVAGNNTGITMANACNSIIWGNVKDNAYDSSFWYATNCCIPVVSMVNQYNIVVVGPDNMMTDPCFVDAAAGDYRLRPESPCIDAGMNSSAAGTYDLLGGMRVRGGGVDIGCFEFVPTVSDTNATHGVTVPPEWLEAHYGLVRGVSPDAAYQAASVAETANPRGGGGTLSAWESYLWDLDPADSNQMARAEIAMVGGAPQVQVAPRSANRVYTLLGKVSLDAGEWARASDFSDSDFLRTNRFFKVSVEAR